jgi:protein-S-isoprenylcysteine O-methyltransferase Ste14
MRNMKTLTLWQIEMIPWYFFAAYWAITWLRVKRTKTTESIAQRLLTILLMVLAFELLFSVALRIWPLRLRFLRAEDWIAWCGVALTTLGIAVAIWARYCIGQYWSARVTLKEGHRLIRSGPYASVRHPIYTGMLLAAIGTALVIGEWRGVLAVVVIWAAHSRKAVREERLMTAEFGEEYAAYRRSTGFLFPRFRRSAGNPSTELHTGHDQATKRAG